MVYIDTKFELIGIIVFFRVLLLPLHGQSQWTGIMRSLVCVRLSVCLSVLLYNRRNIGLSQIGTCLTLLAASLPPSLPLLAPSLPASPLHPLWCHLTQWESPWASPIVMSPSQRRIPQGVTHREVTQPNEKSPGGHPLWCQPAKGESPWG